MTNTYSLAYLATPYTKCPHGLHGAYVAACRLKARLVLAGIHCYSPVAECHSTALYGEIDPLDQRFWLAHLEHIMRKCDSLLVAHLDGWDNSIGMAWEIEQFEAWARPIYDLEPLTLTMALRDWADTTPRLSLCGND